METTIFETEEITRIGLKFGEIVTCVFLVKDDGFYSLVDCGVNETTTNEQLLPALRRLQIPTERIRNLLITHTHFDHVGGLHSLLPRLSNVEVFAGAPFAPFVRPLTDGLRLGALKAIALAGHTSDGFGFLDERTGSLLSGDALQLWGVGNYGVNVENPKAYLETHEKLAALPIENLFGSHAYDFFGERALSKEASKAYIRESEQNYKTLISFVKEKSSVETEARKLCELFAAEREDYPKMQAYTIENILRFLAE